MIACKTGACAHCGYALKLNGWHAASECDNENCWPNKGGFRAVRESRRCPYCGRGDHFKLKSFNSRTGEACLACLDCETDFSASVVSARSIPATDCVFVLVIPVSSKIE